TENTLRHPKIFFNICPTKIVNLADAATLKSRQDSTAVIINVKPVSLLHTIAVDGKRLANECVRNQHGQEFLGELARAIVVGGARNQCWYTICADEGEHQKICCSL